MTTASCAVQRTRRTARAIAQLYSQLVADIYVCDLDELLRSGISAAGVHQLGVRRGQRDRKADISRWAIRPRYALCCCVRDADRE